MWQFLTILLACALVVLQLAWWWRWVRARREMDGLRRELAAAEQLRHEVMANVSHQI